MAGTTIILMRGYLPIMGIKTKKKRHPRLAGYCGLSTSAVPELSGGSHFPVIHCTYTVRPYKLCTNTIISACAQRCEIDNRTQHNVEYLLFFVGIWLMLRGQRVAHTHTHSHSLTFFSFFFWYRSSNLEPG